MRARLGPPGPMGKNYPAPRRSSRVGPYPSAFNLRTSSIIAGRT